VTAANTWCGGNGRHPERTADGLRNHFVYWMYDADGEVPCTRRPEQRWREHQRDNKALVSLVARKTMSGPYDYATARRIERQQQDTLRPTWDTRFRSGRRYARRRPEVSS